MSTLCARCNTALNSAGICEACDSEATVLDAPAISNGHRAAAELPPVSPGPDLTSPQSRSSSGHSDSYYIVPGTVLAARYRVISPVGKGGMGQVYRAEDLKLGETVALKFLPESLANDPAWLGRFFVEVRTAREVTHPNVCRVHDIVETKNEEGKPLTFLTMEFVDGETLADIVRRFGRLPAEKALEIGGEISSALAAAHARGVLHRDLKPANILVDGRGEAKLADFGLALGRGAAQGQELAGTPGYIAPELLKGAPATGRSDLYALGLVLYELLTGHRAVKDGKAHVSGEPGSIRRYAPEVPEAVEQAVLDCLQTLPENRPASAAEVVAAFPARQSDLEAAIARGETPSPEMVADAADDAPMSLRAGWLMLAAIAAILILRWVLSPFGDFLGVMPPQTSPQEAEVHAQDLLKSFGYPVSGLPHRLIVRGDYPMLDWISTSLTPREKRHFAGAPQGALLYTYLQTVGGELLPELTNGTLFTIGIYPSPKQSIVLDSNGRLYSLLIDTNSLAENGSATAADWNKLLDATGLDANSLRPTSSDFAVPFAFDERRAWTGTYPGYPQWPYVVQAAWWQGKPVYLNIVPKRSIPPPSGLVKYRDLMASGTYSVVLVLGGILAYFNLKRKRGDVISATRLALLSLVCGVLCLLLQLGLGWSTRSADLFVNWLDRTEAGFVASSLFIWVAYIAIEPLARKRLSRLLQGSTLFLRGGWDKPRVGREVLVGAFLGITTGITYVVLHGLQWRFWPGGTLNVGEFGALKSIWLGISSWLGTATGAIYMAVSMSVELTVCWLLFRREWVAVLITFLLTLSIADSRGNLLLAVSIAVVFGGMLLYLLLRYGVLASAVGFLTAGVMDNAGWPSNFDSWMLPNTLLTFVFFMGLASLAFWVAIGKRNPFARLNLDF